MQGKQTTFPELHVGGALQASRAVGGQLLGPLVSGPPGEVRQMGMGGFPSPPLLGSPPGRGQGLVP